LSRARLKGSLPLISAEITRFVITLGQGIDLVWHAFDDMSGREIYQRIPSMKVADIVRRRAGRWAGTRRQRSGTL
jgi:FlaA1/EpsC-like NDP-sugar epimerase